MFIGNRIRRARERLGITQKQIGDLFEITPQAVAGWEKGDSDPEPDKYPQLRRKLRVTYAWLIEGGGVPPQPDDPHVLLEDRILAEYSVLAAQEGKARPKQARRR